MRGEGKPLLPASEAPVRPGRDPRSSGGAGRSPAAPALWGGEGEAWDAGRGEAPPSRVRGPVLFIVIGFFLFGVIYGSICVGSISNFFSILDFEFPSKIQIWQTGPNEALQRETRSQVEETQGEEERSIIAQAQNGFSKYFCSYLCVGMLGLPKLAISLSSLK